MREARPHEFSYAALCYTTCRLHTPRMFQLSYIAVCLPLLKDDARDFESRAVFGVTACKVRT